MTIQPVRPHQALFDAIENDRGIVVPKSKVRIVNVICASYRYAPSDIKVHFVGAYIL